jgi:hypothetical protein
LIGRIYPRPSVDGHVETNWPPLFALLCLPLYSLLGFRGLFLLPVAAGIGTALLAGSLARRVVPEAEVPAILAVGLCTPVLFYSCLFWEHTIAVCLGMAALVLCTHKPRLSLAAALAAAVCLAAAIAFRLELVVFTGALAIATIAAAIRHRVETSARASAKMLRFGASAAIALLGATALWTGFVLVHRGETAALFGHKENSLAQLLVGLLTSPRLWREIPSRLQQALIDLPADGGPALGPWLAWLGLLGALVAVVSFAGRDPARSWSLVAGGALLTLVSLTTVLSPDRFRSIHALLLPAPYAVFAVLLLFMPRPPGGRTRWILAATMVLVAASAVVLSLPLLVGGLEWGNRYQLIAYVLTATGCTIGIVFFARHGQPGWPRVAVTAAAGLALAVGGLYQARGLRELAMTKADLNAYRNAVATVSQPVVTDLYWFPAALADIFRRMPVFTLRDPDQLASWIDAVGSRSPRFVVVTDEPPATAGERWRAGAAPHRVELVREQLVAGLVFLEFDVGRGPAPASR